MPAALILALCSWATPGADPYTGSASSAITAKTQVPYATRLKLVERVRRNDFDDVVFIDRDSIRSQQHAYDPDISDMAFGTGRRCTRVDRSPWAPSHVESAMVFCEAGWCVARPSICNNWSIVRRNDPRHLAAPGQRTADTYSPAVGPTVADPFATEPDEGRTFVGLVQSEVSLPVVYATPDRLVIAAVPEPGAWVLMLTGIGLLIGWVRHKRREYRGPHNLAQLTSLCQARTDREDEQFDKYLALTDRPQIVEMWAECEGEPRRPAEVPDMNHWAKWFAANP